MSTAYIPTTLFTTLQVELKKEEQHKNKRFIVGATGVGKTSLLEALYEDVCKNMSQYHVAAASDVHYLQSGHAFIQEKYAFHKLVEEDCKETNVFVFIDNVQDVPVENVSCYKFILKQQEALNLQIVAASSRHGLFTMVQEKIVSPDDFVGNIYVLSPEKSVGTEFYKRLTAAEATAETKEDLEYLGYVPGDILTYITLNKDRLKFRASCLSTACFNLQTDAEQYKLYSDGDTIYCNVLAMLGCDESFSLNDFNLVPGLLPWTYLKSENRQDGLYVSAVSRFVAEACVKFLAPDTDSLMTRIKATGIFFEQLVYARLKKTKRVKYFYYNDEDSIVKSQELDLSAITQFELSHKANVAEMETKRESVTYCPKAKDFGVLLDLKDTDKQLHGVQVTLQTRKTKCANSRFYEGDATNFSYILTPESVDINTVETEISRETCFSRAFKEHHLRIIDPATVLTGEQLKLVRECMRAERAQKRLLDEDME